MIGTRVLVVPHQGIQELPNGEKRVVTFDQDRVFIEEGYYDDLGNEQLRKCCAGYCQRKPKAIFIPIVRDIPASVMLDIKRQLAERDAEATGGSVFDYFEREIGHAPPMIDESDEDDDDD